MANGSPPEVTNDEAGPQEEIDGVPFRYWILRADGTVVHSEDFPEDLVLGDFLTVRTRSAVDRFLVEGPEGAEDQFPVTRRWDVSFMDGVCLVQHVGKSDTKVLVRAYAPGHWMIVTSGMVDVL